ncbi:MAG: tRNA (adenosine(37)-N6)-threonylcarbamoyltransferase complex transferase subunit TsaD [Acidobacteria bacterium]|nr:tRNA (adenosine(37)-N6)-threonylcarbamoyltransferase complex transferase subunit TsaD [Acidobacteriota bacterium]
MRTGLILGIESSCDETAAAVVRQGRETLSNIVASQMKMHALYGGVVPELASREHLRNIVPVVREAMQQADVTDSDLNAIAVTAGPGLAGALLVGISFAKSFAYALGKPLIAVNHLEGHIHAVLMQQQANEGPILALVVSGGHTHLYLAQQREGTWHYRNVGRTVDDAAGEAYDKVAKLLGLGYPGGPWIDTLAAHGNPKAVLFRFQEIKRRDASEEATFDFSFSGIKTAVLRYVETHGMKQQIEARRSELASLKPTDAAQLLDHQSLDVIASFQHAVTQNLARQTLRAAQHFGARTILVSGGVAANRELRRVFAEQANIPVHFPEMALSTDNAAMIAAAAWPRFVAGEHATADLNATPQLRLG